jgi:hypothetical protein
MASILPFVRKSYDFDDQITELLGQAFDQACMNLGDKRHSEVVREVIARRIIEAAKKGERDPDRLRAIALARLNSDSKKSNQSLR